MRWRCRPLAPLLALLLSATALGACTASKLANECPETKHIRCLTPRTCSKDKKRDCLVCGCESAWGVARPIDAPEDRHRSPE